MLTYSKDDYTVRAKGESQPKLLGVEDGIFKGCTFRVKSRSTKITVASDFFREKKTETARLYVQLWSAG